MVKILLADDHAGIRNGLQIIIGQSIPHSVIEYAWDGISVLEKAKNNSYQLIILDANLPKTNVMRLVTDILLFNPMARILVLCIHAEQTFAKKFLKLGAMGYLSKNSPEIEITKAIGNILNNKLYVSSSLLQKLTKEMLKDRTASPSGSYPNPNWE